MASKRTNTLPYHLMLLPGVLLVLVFSYVPIYGVIIAFQRFIPARGMFGNQTWVGLGNFDYLLALPTVWQVFANTLIIAILKIAGGTILPIVVSLLLNEVRSALFRRTVQTIIYFPCFISWIVFGGIMVDLLSPNGGIVNQVIAALGFEPVYFLGDVERFRGTLVVTDVWKTFGFITVTYLAAITSIDPTLYEVASIDGAGRWQKAWHITIPGMGMVIVLLMVLNLGNILNAGFEQVFVLYSPLALTSRHPAGPSWSSRLPGWRVYATDGLPVLLLDPSSRMPPPIPRRNRSVLVSLASRPLSAFPVLTAGRLPHYPFRGLLSVHSRCGLRAR